MAMADYLPNQTADYNGVILSVEPQRTMTETSKKHQTKHEGDDGTIVVTTLSSQSYFIVTLQWYLITIAESDLIFDLWNDPGKANGIGRTFQWEHPTDGHTYVVRFEGDISKGYTSGIVADRGISSIRLRVTGV